MILVGVVVVKNLKSVMGSSMNIRIIKEKILEIVNNLVE